MITIEELRPLTSIKANGLLLFCHVQPGASNTKIMGIYGTTLKIALAAPPVDGKANKELCVFFAKLLNLPKTSVSITSGQTSRNKTLFLPGITLEQLSAKI